MKLHDYQRVGVEFLSRHPRAGLFLDMGLGKTAITLSALTPAHLPVLVVAPKRVAEQTWPEEAALWRPELSIALAVGGPPARKEALASNADIIVIGRDNLKDTAPFRHKFNTLVVDESSGFKNYASVRFKMANGLANRTKHVWLLSGTPAPNGYLDIWSQIYLLDQGVRLGTNITAYRNSWFFPERTNANHVVIAWGMRPNADTEIKGHIQDICLYMESDGRVVLPEISYPQRTIVLDKGVMEVYRQLKQDMVAEFEDLGITISAENAGVLSNRLSQVSSGFIYETDPDTNQRVTRTIHTERMETVLEMLEAATSPVLVAYRFQEEERWLLEQPGARSIKEPGVVAEWNKGNVPILVAHPASAGHGLNLQHGGHTIIWTSPNWELELWLQFNKRLHRQGQKHPVVVHKVVAKGTVDSMVYARLEDKDFVQQDLLDHIRSPI